MTRLEAALVELVAAIREEVAAAATSSPERLLSVEEAADACGLSRTSVYAMLANGRLRSVTAGRRRLIPQSAIDAYARGES